MKLALKIYLSILAVLYATYTINILLNGASPGSVPQSNLALTDNNVRGLAGLLVTNLILIVWAIRDLERTATPLQIICVSLVFSGLGQLVSTFIYGANTAPQFLSMCFSLSAPVLLVWRHYAVASDGEIEAPVKLNV